MNSANLLTKAAKIMYPPLDAKSYIRAYPILAVYVFFILGDLCRFTKRD